MVGSAETQGAEGSPSEIANPWHLPVGWEWTTLGNLGELLRGVSFRKDQVADNLLDGYLPLIRGNNIQDGSVASAELVNVKASCVSSQQILRFGDIVLTMSSGSAALIGKSAWIGKKHDGITFGAFCACFRAAEKYARWIFWFLQTPFYRGRITNLAKGTNINNLKRGHLENLPIPMPPLAERRRIVARIDALFAEIAEGEAALAAARNGLDTFRRALLKAAVTGELTKDWREANPVGETGQDFLDRIAKDRARRATGKRSRRIADSQQVDAATLQELPPGWTWASLGELGEIVGGATVDQKRRPADPVTVPYLRVANVQRGHVDLSEVKRITVERTTAQKLQLRRGDVLLNEGGDRDKIGRGWVWDGSAPDMIHQNHVFRVRLHDGGFNPYFISHYANELGRPFFIEKGKQTTNLASISLSKISTLPVPVPPPQEATEIMRRVSEALAASADTLAVLDAEAADAARLKQSILKAAFEGRLVSQDAADEPADALLARLVASPAVQRARRGRTKRDS